MTMNRDKKGERLKHSADAYKVEPFLFLNSDGEFTSEAKLYGRLSTTDRFLSNFHRPLQRRMLFTKPEDTLPENFVLKHKLSGQVYLLGQERVDSDGSDIYERLNVLHVVSSLSSGHVDITKWQRLPDAADNDMVLHPISIGKFFISLEYQSSRSENNTDQEQSSRMIFHAPADLLKEADEMCEFTLYDRKWSLRQVFYDSGFCSGILIDSGQNIETFYIVNAKNQYDPVSGTWLPKYGADKIPFSASVGESGGDYGFRGVPVGYNERTIYIKAQLQFARNFFAGQLIEDGAGYLWRIAELKNNVRSPDIQAQLVRVHG